MTMLERRRQQFFRSKITEEPTMKLLVEIPNQPSFYMPWDIYTQGQYMLTKEDVEKLEAGCSLRIGTIGGTLLSLEEEPCEKS